MMRGKAIAPYPRLEKLSTGGIDDTTIAIWKISEDREGLKVKVHVKRGALV